MPVLLAGRRADEVIEGFDGYVPWCTEGVYLNTRPTFTADPLFHAGAYYVQEASSMFLAHVLRHIMTCEIGNSRITNCLDLCAAPGGKSTLMRSILPPDCRLIANEPDRRRAQVLSENLTKWGQPNVEVTNLLPADLLSPKSMKSLCGAKDARFDLILTDVPCSGEGMFRKEEEARNQWSPELIRRCAELQRDIVRTAWTALHPGGILIYSTCTFNPEEDEQNILWITRELGATIIEVPLQPEWGIRRFTDLALPITLEALSPDECGTLHSCYHFLPGLVRGEGFFLATLRKPADSQFMQSYANRLEHDADTSLYPTPHVELTLEQAMRYLQRESLILPPDAPRGTITVCFRGQPLGPMKNIGTRANNLYPKEWRVRSTHIAPHTIFL